MTAVVEFIGYLVIARGSFWPVEWVGSDLSNMVLRVGYKYLGISLEVLTVGFTDGTGAYP